MDHQISLDLNDRTLWFDGHSSLDTDSIGKLILNGTPLEKIHPYEIDSDVKQFNLAYSEKKLSIKHDIERLSTDWDIPEIYKNINLKQHLYEKMVDVAIRDKLNDGQILERWERVKQELKLFKDYNIEELIKGIIYIIDTFEENDIVWGTGRGSSCACYSLYLIGLHDVDSVLYDLDLREFFR